jgi:NADH-quinone oxidoreductase subunit M
MTTLLLMIVLLPLASAVLLLVLPGGARVARSQAITVTGLTLVFALALFAAFDRTTGAAQFCSSTPWLSEYGIAFSLGLDGMSLVAVLLTALVAFSGAWVSGAVKSREREFYALYLALVGGAFGAFTTTSVFFFYFFAEFEVLCSYLLIVGWGRDEGEATHRAALQMTLFVAAGAVVTLLGFLVLAAHGGTFDLTGLHDAFRANPISASLQKTLFMLFLAGFGVLLSIWPLHVWAPPAYAAAPTPVSMLSAGVLKQLGAYGLLRFAVPLLPEGARWAVPCLAVLATVNILYGGWIALRQRDWKLLISYGAISHAGYILLGIAALNPVGQGGVVLMMFAGAVSVALLFALAGTMEEQAGSREIVRFSGLARRAPFIGVCTVLAALAAAGVPGFAGFVSEVMVLAGAWMEGPMILRVAVVVGAWGLVLTAVFMLGALREGVFGPPAVDILKVLDARSLKSRLPFLILLAALLAVGLCPRLLTDPVQRSVESVKFEMDKP